MSFTAALITGGGGFLGSHLAERLLNQGCFVICVDNFCTGLLKNKTYLQRLPKSEKLIFIEADVAQEWTWTKQIPEEIQKKISHVFHFASPASPPHYQRLAFETIAANTEGLKQAMAFADKNSARVVFASTSEIYGDPNVSPQPESYWGNVNTMGIRSCYDEAKRMGETLIFTHNWKFKTQHGLVRIFNTYGPRMNPNDGRVIINFLVQALKGEELTVYGDGQQTRSFCYVDDLISGVIAYAESKLTEPINLGSDKEFTVLELSQTVQNIFSSTNIKTKFFPLPQDDPRQRRPDLSKAKSLLSPWKPQVELKSGLEKMISWLKEEI